MVTKDRLKRCALTPFPWGGKTKSRQLLKNKPILSVLFRDPSWFKWVYDKSNKDKNFHFLHKEMELLLDAIKTIQPTAKCPYGNQIFYWSVYNGKINGHYTACNDHSCKCRNRFATDNNSLVPHTFYWMFDFLDKDIFEKIYLEGFKLDYGLPLRYSEQKYLDWLLNNAQLNQLVL